ncbi:winged helix-turn-helix transcriptional regulator [Streptomyces tuirus]|uniref:Winged helix-turn-helix transcriptional regulator n=1 Tax=Streptomyces tuirus TaxID=68278 RepID=A0A941FF41_9ACTN|nr:winged helix-turn-helix transcriptional regulator [Streptomyces tuirus]
MVDLKRLHHDLVRLETELWNTLEARLRAEHGLPITWFLVMRYVDRHPGRRIQDIAHEFAITAGGTSKVVDRIESAGYCRRRPHPRDRRSAIVELTVAGQDLVGRATEAFEAELHARIGTVVTGQALEQFAATLRSLLIASTVR